MILVRSYRDWLCHRRVLQEDVTQSVQAVHAQMRIKGSFNRGDFHLSAIGYDSYSDVDILLEDDGRSRHDWEAEVADRLRDRGHSLRVSVQHFDTTTNLSTDESQLLTMAEAVRFWRRSSDDLFAPYLLGKTTSSLVRSQLQGPTSIGMNHALVIRAWRARLGAVRGFDRSMAGKLISLLPATRTTEAYVQLLETSDLSKAFDWLVPRLTESNIHPWLKKRMQSLLVDAVS